MRDASLFGFWLAGAVLLSSASMAAGPASPAAVAPSSGTAMCSALAPDDFTKAGIRVERPPEAGTDPGNDDGAYCNYDSTAGKVEFDIFYPAGATPQDVQAAERAASAAIGGKFERVELAGADEARTNAAAPKDADSASILVRKGDAVFDINIPQGPNARQQLLTLARLVVSRLKQ